MTRHRARTAPWSRSRPRRSTPSPRRRRSRWPAGVGYDAVEVMVGIDQTSQDIAAVKHLQDYHGHPGLRGARAVPAHHPAGLGHRPLGQARDVSAEMAHEVGADVVVVHPPFRWQRDYARGFVEGIALLEERTGIAFAVENMYPWRASRAGDAGLRCRTGTRPASTTPTPRSTSPTPPPRGPTR